MYLCIIISLTEFNNQFCSNSCYHVRIDFLLQSSSEKARSSADSVWLSSLTVNTSSAVSLSNNLHLWPIRVVWVLLLCFTFGRHCYHTECQILFAQFFCHYFYSRCQNIWNTEIRLFEVICLLFGLLLKFSVLGEFISSILCMIYGMWRIIPPIFCLCGPTKNGVWSNVHLERNETVLARCAGKPDIWSAFLWVGSNICLSVVCWKEKHDRM